jgi:hypothetical protein
MPAREPACLPTTRPPDGVRGTRATGLKKSRPFPLRTTLELDVWGLTRMSNPTKHSLHLQPLPSSNVFDFRLDSRTWAPTAESKSRGAKVNSLFSLEIVREGGCSFATLVCRSKARGPRLARAGRCFGSGVRTSNPDAQHVSTPVSTRESLVYRVNYPRGLLLSKEPTHCVQGYDSQAPSRHPTHNRSKHNEWGP